jgi:hypothetical protein
MTASIRIRYKNSVVILPSDGSVRGRRALLPSTIPPFIVRGHQPQGNSRRPLDAWSSFLSAPHHACQQAARCFTQGLHSLLRSLLHVRQHGASEGAKIRNGLGEIRNVVR